MLIMAMAIAAQSAPTELNQKVDINGHTYRVYVHGPEVKVFNKSALVAIGKGRTIERRKEMEQAVEKVTGCRMDEPFWRNQVLAGGLICPQ